MFQSRLQRFGALTWRQRIVVVVGITVALALALGLLILSFTLAIILLPIVAIAILIARFRLGRAIADAERRAGASTDGTDGPQVIDAEFEIVDNTQQDRRP